MFNVQNWLKGFELYIIPVDNLTRTWQGTWMKRFFPYDVFGRLASLNIKMAEKERKNIADSGTSRHFAGALCHDAAPRDFGPRFA